MWWLECLVGQCLVLEVEWVDYVVKGFVGVVQYLVYGWVEMVWQVLVVGFGEDVVVIDQLYLVVVQGGVWLCCVQCLQYVGGGRFVLVVYMYCVYLCLFGQVVFGVLVFQGGGGVLFGQYVLV